MANRKDGSGQFAKFHRWLKDILVRERSSPAGECLGERGVSPAFEPWRDYGGVGHLTIISLHLGTAPCASGDAERGAIVGEDELVSFYY